MFLSDMPKEHQENLWWEVIGQWRRLKELVETEYMLYEHHFEQKTLFAILTFIVCAYFTSCAHFEQKAT